MFLFFVVLSQCVEAESTKVAIIASSDVKSLNLEEIKSAFSLKQVLIKNGAPLQLVQQPSANLVTQKFTQALFQLYPYQLQRLWDSQIDTGRVSPPTQLTSDADVLLHLLKHTNTIAYVTANSQMLGEYSNKINILAIL